MIETSGYSPLVDAGILIGIVLVEAIVLYVGYGVLEEAFGQMLIERIKST